MRLLGAALVVTLTAFAAACGTEGLPSESASSSRGKELFTSPEGRCAACHALADARSKGTVGPNLDDAFFGARKDGFEESSIAAVVLAQIQYPTRGSGMPADLVTGEDAEAVAAYVAEVAGDPDKMKEAEATKGTKATDGKSIFADAGCGSCHTFAAAGANGKVGPNLDQSKPSVELAISRVTSGKGQMPAFGSDLTEQQIRAVAEFVSGSKK